MKRRSFLTAVVAAPFALLGLKTPDPVLRFPRLKGRKELKKKLTTIKPSGTYFVIGDCHVGIEPPISDRDTIRMFGHDPDDVTPEEFLKALGGSDVSIRGLPIVSGNHDVVATVERFS